jgi:hypothetical protein
MKGLLFALFCLLTVLSHAQSILQSCNCPPNEFGYSKAKKADTVFSLSNNESIALCGYRDTVAAKGRNFYSEFILAVCGENKVIKFWGAVLECQLRVYKDTLIVETLDSLPTGKNMQNKWTVWTIEHIFFQNGEAKRDFNVNRQIPKYNQQEIKSVLDEYEVSIRKPVKPNTVNNVNMEIADKLFMSAISGSKKARAYLASFNNHFGGLSGEYLEWYDDLKRKIKEWDTNISSDDNL